MSDATDENLLYSSVTAGALMRWLNSECVEAVKSKDTERAKELAERSGLILESLKQYLEATDAQANT